MIKCACLPKQSWWKTFWSGPPRVRYCSVTGRRLKDFPKILSLGATSLDEVILEEQIWLHGVDDMQDGRIA